MPIRKTHSIFTLLAAVVLLFAPAATLAQENIEAGKTYRIVLVNGREVVGEVTDVGNAYKVKVGSGITQTVKKTMVRRIEAINTGTGNADESDLATLKRRAITDEEIKEILGSESVEDLYVWDYIAPVDLMQPLPLDKVSLEEMKRIAGKKAKVLETPHFVCVYTSDRPAAQRLVARLEIVYKWNVTFERMYDIPPKKPEHKFEIYYFGTYDEYRAYQTLNGFMMQGALGFYMRTNNRCAFFDMRTWPPVANILKVMNDRNTPFQERRRAENAFKRWSNFTNLEVVQHEATHAIQFNIGIFPKGADTGKWMTEGLCVQFEVPPTQEGGSFGSINYTRLNSYHRMYGRHAERVPWTFVKQLVLADGSGIHDYVMGWALNYYLRKQYKEQYGKFLRHLANKEDDWSVRTTTTERLAEFEDHFGKLDEAWVKKFFDYIAKIPLKKSAIVEFPTRKP